MIAEYIITKIADIAYDQAKEFIAKNFKKKLNSSKTDLFNALAEHINMVSNWANEISFKDLKKSRSLSQTYIELDIYLTPKKRQYFEEESHQIVPLKKVFSRSEKHIVLLGQPGAGKTTSLKKICYDLIYKDSFDKEGFSFPIVIRINELSFDSEYSIFQRLYSIFNLKVEKGRVDGDLPFYRAIIPILNSNKLLLIIDGFDEIANFSEREKVTKELRDLALNLSNSRIILTSRSGDYSINIEGTTVFEICPLNSKQIQAFAKKWFKNTVISDKFLDEVNQTGYSDTLERPIFISLLCSIYERLGKIPDKPKTVYRKVVSILLEEWDEQRSIRRASKYAQLDVDRRIEFLSHLSFYMTTNYQSLVFDREMVKMFYKKCCTKYDLPSDEYFQVIEELESHHGIFIQDGHDKFKFYHKSMQEYLSAEYIRGLPTIPGNLALVSKLPNEFAIAITLSSSPTDYFVELIFGVIGKDLSIGFLNPFLNRLYNEKPNFESNPMFALLLIWIYNTISNEPLITKEAFQALKSFLLTREFNTSYTLLKTDKNFSVHASLDMHEVVHYSGVNLTRYNLSYMYNKFLKIDKIYVKRNNA